MSDKDAASVYRWQYAVKWVWSIFLILKELHLFYFVSVDNTIKKKHIQMKSIFYCLLQSLFNRLVCIQTLNAIQSHQMEGKMNAETSWRMVLNRIKCLSFRSDKGIAFPLLFYLLFSYKPLRHGGTTWCILLFVALFFLSCLHLFSNSFWRWGTWWIANLKWAMKNMRVFLYLSGQWFVMEFYFWLGIPSL